MMGQHSRSEALFYYFRLEDQVPENHLLRLIEKHIDLAFVREKLKGSYSGYGIRVPDPGYFTVPSADATAAENQGVPEEPASRLFPRDRRRIRRTAERF